MNFIFAINNTETGKLKSHVSSMGGSVIVCGCSIPDPGKKNCYDFILLQNINEEDLTAIKLIFIIKDTKDTEVQSWID